MPPSHSSLNRRTVSRLAFGAVLRHELNNPLIGILGNAELLAVELRTAPAPQWFPGVLPCPQHFLASCAKRESRHHLTPLWLKAQQPFTLRPGQDCTARCPHQTGEFTALWVAVYALPGHPVIARNVQSTIPFAHHPKLGTA
jgi:hypothetical protein